MNEISDAQLLNALHRQLSLASARQVVAAGNLANVNTPGFKAREVDFSQSLDAALGAPLAATDARHLQPGGVDARAGTHEQTAAARRDGNTVQIDRELLEMTRAAGDFAKAQTALAAKFRLVRYALSESR